MASISEGNIVEPLKIEVAKGPAHCNAIEASEAKPWYEDIKNFLQTGQYPPFADRCDRKTLRRLTMHYFLSGEILYRRSFDSTLLRCINEHESQRLMEEVHGGNCGPHMNGLMLAKKIMRLSYYWSTMETDCVKHWIEAITLASVTTKVVARILKRDVIARYRVPATIITDNAKNLNNKCYQQRMARAFNAKVCPREFSPGDLVLKKVLHVAPDSRGKFSYKYDGPYVVKEIFSGGAVILSDMDGTENALPVNADAIKKSKTSSRRPRQKLGNEWHDLKSRKGESRQKESINHFLARSKTSSRRPRQKLGNEWHDLKSRKGESRQKESINHFLARSKTSSRRPRQKLEDPRGAISPQTRGIVAKGAIEILGGIFSLTDSCLSHATGCALNAPETVEGCTTLPKPTMFKEGQTIRDHHQSPRMKRSRSKRQASRITQRFAQVPNFEFLLGSIPAFNFMFRSILAPRVHPGFLISCSGLSWPLGSIPAFNFMFRSILAPRVHPGF
ncbi:hypothetical protein CRG98_031148 [Punica granatum]|uniref:Integrase catalytic domain-containing protein n=1 Tax=Punica granatum TaxID=22663 RepID=A0A2I0IWR0_PUNGR|nr:hypothetical protein CRG98_031148 [Punica granatum]